MDCSTVASIPANYTELLRKSEAIGFTMASDMYVGTLLRTLVASKPSGNFLELGTGMGLTLSWMIEGMDSESHLVTLDSDPELVEITKHYFGDDTRISMLCQDGTEWIRKYRGERFDLIFADAWPGKYSDLEETLRLLKVGGFYIVDDMLPQTNWPEGHEGIAASLIGVLEKRDDLTLTKLNWSSGVIIAVKTK